VSGSGEVRAELGLPSRADSIEHPLVHRLSVLLLLVCVAGPLGGCGHVGHEGVRAGIEQLASISAEGALMANDVARGRTKTTFVRVHGAELSAQAEHEAEKLNDAPVSAGLQSSIEAAIELSSDIGGAIDDLRVSPQDREQAHQDESKLRRWADEARTLAEKL
jgi:hypothetical protein